MSEENMKHITCDRCGTETKVNMTGFGAHCDWVHIIPAWVLPTHMMMQSGPLQVIDLCPQCNDKFKQFIDVGR